MMKHPLFRNQLFRIPPSFQVENERWTAKAGETLRYKADRPHSITNVGETPVHATMVNILAHAVRAVS